ncbi:MAG TPA: hypothetical protein VNT99_20855 [Methylomirabilota bacterium]|nr:hypothetical protein [Methylomirabilota bacterium]
MIALLAWNHAGAALLAYEPFDYPPSELLSGQSSGTGFVGSWEQGGFNAYVNDVFRISPGALTYHGLVTKGSNHVAVEAVQGPGIAGLTRFFSNNIAVPGQIYYLSFLHRPDAAEDYASLVVGIGEGKELSIGKSGTVRMYHISQRGGVNRVLSDVTPVVGRTVFLVVKMDFRDGPDRFTLFVNPAPGKPEPVGAFIKDDLDLEFADRICLYSRAAWSVDEIRFGDTWNDVTPALAAPGK